jgi:uncharacterized membrane protein HdeD (DUF308 family)
MMSREACAPPSGPTGRHRLLHLVEGAILVFLGIAAVFVPFRLGITLLWWLFLIGGVTGLATTLMMRSAPGFWWSLLSAVLALSVAAMLFAMPELAVVGIPLLLMGFLVLEGGVTVMLALEHWRQLSGRWGWMLASGLVDLSLAAFILLWLPATAPWTLGLILAVNLIFGGGAMIGMALGMPDRQID